MRLLLEFGRLTVFLRTGERNGAKNQECSFYPIFCSRAARPGFFGYDRYTCLEQT